MKLVQMPRDLLTVGVEELPALGVHPDLVEALAARGADDPLMIGSLALLGPRAAGTTPALMVLARRIGAALRDANIRLRDGGGDLRDGRRKLCYLPGSALPAALVDPKALGAIESEAVLFLQDLEGAWNGGRDAGPAVQSEFVAGGERVVGAEVAVGAEQIAGGGESTPNELVARAVAALLAERRRRGLRTFVSADPTALPPSVYAALVAELEAVTVAGAG